MLDQKNDDENDKDGSYDEYGGDADDGPDGAKVDHDDDDGPVCGDDDGSGDGDDGETDGQIWSRPAPSWAC